MDKPETISIITVCYNSAKTIAETIQSVLSQDYPAIEYIIIDGASKDGTLNIIQSYVDKIALIVSEPDKGIYDAMNKGISLATGKVVALLNADDLYANSKVISNVMSKMRDETVQACYGDLIYFRDKEPHKSLRYWQSGPFQKGAFAKGWSPAHPTFFVRKSVYEQYGVFNISYNMGNDVELMMRFLEKYQIKTSYLPAVLVNMRLGGVSNRGIKNLIIQNKCILKAATDLGVPISLFPFVIHKLLNRLWQFISKPQANRG